MRCKVLHCEYREYLDYCVPPLSRRLSDKKGSKIDEGKNKKGQNMCIGSPKKNLISLFLAVKVY